MSGTQIGQFLGGGRPLMETELPTVRASMRAALYIKDQKFVIENTRRNMYTVKQMMEDLLPHVKCQWEKASSKLKAPILIQDKTIVNKLVKYWEQVRDVSSGRMNNAQKKEVLNSQLDKLLDMTQCRCTILTCPEATCMGCKYEAHITCNCPKEIKLPKTELRFIKDQRAKVGDLSSFQIITKNVIESNRLNKSDS